MTPRDALNFVALLVLLAALIVVTSAVGFLYGLH